MKIKVSLQPHNGKFEGEFFISCQSQFIDELREQIGSEAVIVECTITTMHHQSRSSAKTTTKKLMRLLAQKLIEEAK